MSSEKNNSDSGSGKRKKKSSSDGADRLYLKRQQLLREMQDSGEEKAINIREQLRTLEEAGKQVVPTEDDWGKPTSRRKNNLWVLWVILGLAIPTVLIALALMMSRMGDRTGGATSGSGGFNFDSLNTATRVQPEDWFVENSTDATRTGIDILEKLSQDNLTKSELAQVVRNETQVERILARQATNDWPGFDLRRPTEIVWQFSSYQDTGFMALIGPRSDYSTFRAYFVRGESGLRYDADASEGWSETPIIELPAANLSEPSMTRGWVAKEPHFDARSDSAKYSWYQILTPNLIDFVWAYTEAGGELDEKLKTELNYGRVIGERKREFRAVITLTASGVEDFREDEFLLKELIAVDWVLPNG